MSAMALALSPVHAIEQLERQVGFTQMSIGAAVGQKAALAIGIDKTDQRACRIGLIAAQMSRDPLPFEMAAKPDNIGGADAGGEMSVHAHGCQPHGLIGARTTRHLADGGRRIGAPRHRPLRHNENIGDDVADNEDAPGHC